VLNNSTFFLEKNACLPLPKESDRLITLIKEQLFHKIPRHWAMRAQYGDVDLVDLTQEQLEAVVDP
jgi:hypothetical protein